jgi:hypothetical protein
LDFPHLPPPAEVDVAPDVTATPPPAAPLDPTAEILDAVRRAQESLVASAAQIVAASFAPPPGKWSRASLRRVGLSALKAFVTAAVAVTVAKSHGLAGSHLDTTTIESTLFAVGIAGGGAALKVVEIFLEDK